MQIKAFCGYRRPKCRKFRAAV